MTSFWMLSCSYASVLRVSHPLVDLKGSVHGCGDCCGVDIAVITGLA